MKDAVIYSLLLLASCNDRPAGYGDNCCVEHEWPTTAANAKTYAMPDSVDTNGCPSRVGPNDKIDAGGDPDGGNTAPPGLVELKANDGGACVYKSYSCCPGGRPLLGSREPILAQRVRGTAWSKKKDARRLAHRPDLARAWLEEGLAEHASIASFARATLELMAAGAPPELLAAHQRAALDEIRHAEMCFALAVAYGGDPIDPGPIAVPAPRTGGLAKNVFLEGCVAETIGALVAARALEACTEPRERAALERIARDETEHAALAWRTLAWAIARGEPIPEIEFESIPTFAGGRTSAEDMRRATEDAWRFVIEPNLLKIRHSMA